MLIDQLILTISIQQREFYDWVKTFIKSLKERVWNVKLNIKDLLALTTVEKMQWDDERMMIYVSNKKLPNEMCLVPLVKTSRDDSENLIAVIQEYFSVLHNDWILERNKTIKVDLSTLKDSFVQFFQSWGYVFYLTEST